MTESLYNQIESYLFFEGFYMKYETRELPYHTRYRTNNEFCIAIRYGNPSEALVSFTKEGQAMRVPSIPIRSLADMMKQVREHIENSRIESVHER